MPASSVLDKVARRRETNRKSQQKSRENKESLIRTLQEENERLRLQVSRNSAQASSHSPPSLDSFPQSSSITSSLVDTPTGSTRGLAVIDLEAARQAFLAVLASVCDPHLNTIHAVCQNFNQARGHASSAPTLNPPRPVNRPLNQAAASLPSPEDLFGFDLEFEDLLPQSAFLPAAELCGPLSVPFLEAPHPMFNLELDANDVWTYVLGQVDMGRTDAELLATRITEKVRCYGFGPVVLTNDMKAVCDQFPKLFPGISPSSAG